MKPQPMTARTNRIPLVSDCIPWLGYLERSGHAKMWLNGRKVGAQRAVYVKSYGPIPDGLDIDHLCRNPSCVNPEHLEAVPPGENTRRSWPAEKTKCVNGHPYDEANTYIRPTGRRDRPTSPSSAAAREPSSKLPAAANPLPAAVGKADRPVLDDQAVGQPFRVRACDVQVAWAHGLYGITVRECVDAGLAALERGDDRRARLYVTSGRVIRTRTGRNYR